MIPFKETHRGEEGTKNKEEYNITGYNKYATWGERRRGYVGYLCLIFVPSTFL